MSESAERQFIRHGSNLKKKKCQTSSVAKGRQFKRRLNVTLNFNFMLVFS